MEGTNVSGSADYEHVPTRPVWPDLVRRRQVTPTELLEAASTRVADPATARANASRPCRGEARLDRHDDGRVDEYWRAFRLLAVHRLVHLTGQPAMMLPLGRSPEGLQPPSRSSPATMDEARYFPPPRSSKSARPWFERKPALVSWRRATIGALVGRSEAWPPLSRTMKPAGEVTGQDQGARVGVPARPNRVASRAPGRV